MPRYPHLERMFGGVRQEPVRDPNMPAYWANGPVYRLESPYRPPIYYRAAGYYPPLPAPSVEIEAPAWLVCASCGAMNGTPQISGQICMGCFSEQRQRQYAPPPPPPPPAPRFTKADAAKILGLPWPGITKDQVTDAYRKLALELHQDHGGSDEKLREILRARDRLIPPPKQLPR